MGEPVTKLEFLAVNLLRMYRAQEKNISRTKWNLQDNIWRKTDDRKLMAVDKASDLGHLQSRTREEDRSVYTTRNVAHRDGPLQLVALFFYLPNTKGETFL